MKKILWIPAVLLLFLFGDRIGGTIFKVMTEKSNFRYSKVYTGNNEAEILLVGNSRGLVFYQPEIEKITGKRTANLSYNGMPVYLAEALVGDYLEKYETTETLLIDVTLADRKNDNLVTGFSPYLAYSDRLASLLEEKNKTAFYATQLSWLYRYNSEVWQRAVRYLKGSDKTWLNNRVMNEFLIENVTNEKPLDFTFAEAKNKELKKEFSGDKLIKSIKKMLNMAGEKEKEFSEEELIQSISNMVNMAKQKGVDVHLVINPYYPEFIQRANAFPEWIAMVERITGEKVHNYATLIKDPKLFADYQHPNLKGAELYLKQLKQDGLLP